MLEQCEPDDPNRCQTVTIKGQCIWKGLKLSNGSYAPNCEAHGGNKTQQSIDTQAIKNYQLGKWQARIDQKKAAPELKNLRDEIAILRMVLEEKLLSCNSATDLMLLGGSIADLILKIEKVVTSCHKLEQHMGMVVDKQAILNFAGKVIQIVTLTLEDTENGSALIDDIGNHILEAIGKIGEEEEGELE